MPLGVINFKQQLKKNMGMDKMVSQVDRDVSSQPEMTKDREWYIQMSRIIQGTGLLYKSRGLQNEEKAEFISGPGVHE